MSTARTLPASLRWLGRPSLSFLRDVVAPALLVALAAAGLGVSTYLTYTHWADQAIVCGGLGNCELVQNSEYATLGPVPIALLGALMYAGLGGLAFITLWRRPSEPDWPILAFWAGALAGTVYSAYLTYLELFVLEAICVYCVASAGLVTGSLVVSTAYILALPGNPEHRA